MRNGVRVGSYPKALYHSDVSVNTGRHSVAIALSGAANAALLKWAPISPRLTKIRLIGVVATIAMIAVFDPTLDAADAAKDNFYTYLQDTIDGLPVSDTLVVAGNWNRRAGPAKS